MKGRNKFAKFSKYFLMFFAVAFMGWLWETVYFCVANGKLLDRGFLTIPVCPIYGFAILGVYFLLGTPDEGRGLLNRVYNHKLLVVLYFLLAALIPTVIEYITGWFFDHVMHMPLWSYDGNFMNIDGYICPSVTIFWGICITLAMKFIFPRIQRLFAKIPDIVADVLTIVLLPCLCADFVHCIVKTVSNLP